MFIVDLPSRPACHRPVGGGPQGPIDDKKDTAAPRTHVMHDNRCLRIGEFCFFSTCVDNETESAPFDTRQFTLPVNFCTYGRDSLRFLHQIMLDFRQIFVRETQDLGNITLEAAMIPLESIDEGIPAGGLQADEVVKGWYVVCKLQVGFIPSGGYT